MSRPVSSFFLIFFISEWFKVTQHAQQECLFSIYKLILFLRIKGVHQIWQNPTCLSGLYNRHLSMKFAFKGNRLEPTTKCSMLCVIALCSLFKGRQGGLFPLSPYLFLKPLNSEHPSSAQNLRTCIPKKKYIYSWDKK